MQQKILRWRRKHRRERRLKEREKGSDTEFVLKNCFIVCDFFESKKISEMRFSVGGSQQHKNLKY